VPYVATWDDHDYGLNNAGEDFYGKEVAKDLYFDFFEVPMNDERRTRGGIYKTYTFGPEGKRLQVILLDGRWFKTDETILGEEQWSWLVSEFAKPADLRIVVNGFQFLGNLYEGWYEYPSELKKMLSIIPDNVVFLSGDRHIGSFYQVDAMGAGTYGGTFPDNRGNPVESLDKADYSTLPLLEVTASSLTHTWNTAGLELGNNRVPGYDIVRTDHFGQVSGRTACCSACALPCIMPQAQRTRALRSQQRASCAHSSALCRKPNERASTRQRRRASRPAPSSAPAQLDIDWDARTLRASLVPSNAANENAPPGEIGQTVTIDMSFPPAKMTCPPGCVHSSRRLLFSTVPVCPPGCEEAPSTSCPVASPADCKPEGTTPGAAVRQVLPSLGTYPADPLLFVSPNVSITALISGGEVADLALDSIWQVPEMWNGLGMVSGPHDGAGMRVLSKGMLRYYVNNEISAGSGIMLRYSATEEAGSPGQRFPAPTEDESFIMNGATIRYFDMEVEFKSSATVYTPVAAGVAVKRIYISTEAAPMGELVTSVDKMMELTGLEGMSRWCGGSFHNMHQFSHLLNDTGFEDPIYLAGHEDAAFGAVGVLDVTTGNTYLLPTPAMVETATPLFTNSSEYVAMVVNIYPEPEVGQRIHLYYGKKVGTDFLGRNGLNPMYGQFYVLTVPDHPTWEDMTADEVYPGTFVPIETATGAINSGNDKNEWSTVNQLSKKPPRTLQRFLPPPSSRPLLSCRGQAGNGWPFTPHPSPSSAPLWSVAPMPASPRPADPMMWAQAMTGLADVTINRMAFDAESDGWMMKNGVELPAQITATTKRFRLQEVDPIFGDPDSVYWSPKGALMIAEDGSEGRVLRMALDAEGNSDRQLTELARVADESLRTQLNSIPPLSLTAASQAEFTGIIPHGFYHLLEADASPMMRLQAEIDSREQYIMNLQLHSLSSGMIDTFSLGESSQTLRFDIEPDPSGAGPKLYAWDGVDFYNARREEYCAANDCSDMRGPFVAGEVVRVSDFAALEIWRGLAPGTYMDDLQAIIDESLGYGNLETALPYAWDGVDFYNARREEYCAANDCSEMRGPFVAGDVVLESDFEALEVWRDLAPGTYMDDIQAIVDESLGYGNLETALPYAWLGVSYYNGLREDFCAANDCSEMRGPYVAGEIVLESDFEILEVWRGLPAGTYMDDLTEIIDESLSFENMEPVGF
jgi:hypothetical protein